MKNLAMVVSMVAVLASCGRSNSTASETSSAVAVQPTAVVVDGFSAAPTNGGINPTARAVDVSVGFTAGSNACVASHYQYKIEQVHVGNVIHVVVKSTRIAKFDHMMCPMNYMPVFMNLHTTVHSSTTAPVSIVVDNVKSLGHNVVVKI